MIQWLADGLNPDHRALVEGMLGLFVAFFLFGFAAGYFVGSLK